MKKLGFLLISALLVATTLVGCAPKVYKVGSGAVTSIKAAPATAEASGKVQVNTTYAGVVLDSKGKIVEVKFDVAQNQYSFKTDGTIDGEVEVPTPTKKEKGDAYGMKAASGIGKEWYEQIAAFEAWIVGKTFDEVKAIKLDEATATTEEDLKASVTIKLSGYLAALEAAVNNAKEVKGVAKVGIASYTTGQFTPATAADATANPAVEAKDGRVRYNVNFALVALDKAGKVLYVAIDNAQNGGGFDAMGALTFDPAAPTPTKKEKGDAYGMKSASAIGKEWFEQMAAFETWMVGKTVEEIKAMKVTDTTAPAEEDLKATVTIKVADYLKALDMAAAAAVEIK
jgi:uncharacterized protein (DUF4415 family)